MPPYFTINAEEPLYVKKNFIRSTLLKKESIV